MNVVFLIPEKYTENYHLHSFASILVLIQVYLPKASIICLNQTPYGNLLYHESFMRHICAKTSKSTEYRLSEIDQKQLSISDVCCGDKLWRMFRTCGKYFPAKKSCGNSTRVKNS